MKNFKIGDKITRVPLIQGGMGVGISLGRLAGSVAKAGGVGIISTAQIGYREEDFDRNPAAANERAIASEMKKARGISRDGIIGYNIMVALKEYASHVKAAVKAGADIIMLDNMDDDMLKEAIAYIDHRAEIEVSGNVTKENIARLTNLGVDYVSSGALTHSAPILDLSLKNLHVL